MKHKIISGKELFDLIKSLTKAEKRHFKMFAGNESGKKFYLKLFDILNEQDEYDEEKASKTLRKQDKTSKNFSLAKKYLFEKIIASLHSLGTYKNADSQVKELIETARLLRYKGLYNQAARHLEMAEQEAIECDTIYNRLAINAIQFQFTINSVDPKQSPEERTAILNAKGKNIADITLKCQDVYHVFRTVKSIQVENPFCRSKEEQDRLSEIIKPLHNLNYQDIPTVGSKIHFHLALSTYNTMIGNPAGSMEHCQQIIELVKANPKIDNTIYPHLSNYIGAAIKARQVEHIDKYLNELYEGIKVNPDFHEQKLIYERWLLYNIQSMNIKGKFKEAIQLYEKQKEKIKEYSPFTQYIHFQIIYHLSVAHFFAKNYNASWSFITQVLNEQNMKFDIYVYAKMFSLMILHERNETDLLQHSLRSAQRLLEKKDRSYLPEKSILDFMKGSGNIGTLKNALENPHEQGMLYYFDIIRWLETKN
jgi:hypothetical protein